MIGTLGVGARLSSEPAEIVRRLTFGTKEAARPEEVDLFEAMARVNLAHIVMLAERKLIPSSIASQLAEELLAIRQQGMARVPLDIEAGDLYPQIERHVANVVSDEAAGYLQYGRSRGDVIPAATRLKLRSKTLRLLEALLELRISLIQLSAEHAETIMPAYTHWQQSQVMTFGHFLARWVSWFGRDADRLYECITRHNVSPLGSANGVGTSVAVDRERVASLLGHSQPTETSGDGTYSWDYMVEPVSVAALMASNAARLMSNFILWHTQEFRMLSLSDRFATASTYLPHKKNPEPLETVKVFSELIAGDLSTVYFLQRNDDWPHDLINHGHTAMNHALDSSLDTIELSKAILDDLVVDPRRMKELATGSFVTASELANMLVETKKIPFRLAHEVVGLSVRKALDENRSTLTAGDVRSALKDLVGADVDVDDEFVSEAMNASNFVERMSSLGSVRPAELRRFLAGATDRAKRDSQAVSDLRLKFNSADEELVAAAKLLSSPAGVSS